MVNLEIVGYDKEGPLFEQNNIRSVAVASIGANTFFKHRVIRMSKDLDKATSLVEAATQNFDIALKHMQEAEQRVTIETKKAAGRLKDSAQKIGEGIARIEKQADFNRLERYVDLLERADAAFTSLAELHTTGKLEKIASAIR